MIPPSLEQLVAVSLESVHDHPLHALLPLRRRAIYDYLGPVRVRHAHHRRVWLDILTVKYVLPLWHEERPTDERAQRLLTLAEQVLSERVDKQAAGDEAEAIWRWLTDDDHGGRYEKLLDPAYYTLGAAIMAVFVSLDENPLVGMILGEDETDANIDLASSDTAKWASNAIAGPVWKPDSDRDKRLDFWTWWLTEAVPAAWQHEDVPPPDNGR